MVKGSFRIKSLKSQVQISWVILSSFLWLQNNVLHIFFFLRFLYGSNKIQTNIPWIKNSHFNYKNLPRMQILHWKENYVCRHGKARCAGGLEEEIGRCSTPGPCSLGASTGPWLIWSSSCSTCLTFYVQKSFAVSQHKWLFSFYK